MATFDMYCANILQFSQSTATHPFQVNASNSIVFSQSVKVSPIYVSVSNHLSLVQKVTLNQAIINVSVSNHLSLSQQVRKVIEVSIHQIFFPHQGYAQTNIQYPKVSNKLSFTQIVTPVVSKPIINTLTFTQTVSVNIVKNVSLISIFNLQSNVTAYKENKNIIAITIPPITPPAGDDGRCSE